MADEKKSSSETSVREGLISVARDLRHGKSKKTGKVQDFYNYYIVGRLKGKDKKVQIVPADNGGFANLDTIFECSDEAHPVHLQEQVNEFTDSNGVIRTGTAYYLFVEIENGKVLRSRVTPRNISDKDCLANLELKLSITDIPEDEIKV